MKTIRLFLALGFTALLIGSAVGADSPKPAEPKQPAGCDCAKDKDGKVCGVDKDCCCTGQKACKTSDKPDEKKDPKSDGKKSG